MNSKHHIITILFLALVIGAKANDFSNGLATGYIIKNIDNRLSSKEKKYERPFNMMTVDTGLMIFPPNQTPKCMEVKIIEPLRPLTILQRMIIAIIFTLLFMPLLRVFLYGSDADREWLMGYLIGYFIERFLDSLCNDDD